MTFPQRRLLRTEGGQGLVEYALILMLVAVVAVAGLRVFGPALFGTYSQIEARLPY